MDFSNISPFISHSVGETEEFGARFAKLLSPGSVVALRGDMGMGKTQLVRGIVSAFGDANQVSSPTFAIVHQYHTNPVIYHFDMYRVFSEDDLYSTGFYEYLDGCSILLIEWSENIEDLLPDGTIFVTIDRIDDTVRKITVEMR